MKCEKIQISSRNASENLIKRMDHISEGKGNSCTSLNLLTAFLQFRDKLLPTGRQGGFRYKIFSGIPVGSQ